MTRFSIVAAIALAACSNSTPTPAPTPVTATLTGKVVFPSGRLDGVAITAIGPSPAGTRSAADGNFTLKGLTDGSYLVRAEHPDAEPRELSIDVEITNGTPSREVTFTFAGPPRQLTGRAVLHDSSDASDITVTLTGEGQAFETKAATDGAFRFQYVRTGVLRLSARAANTAEGSISFDVVTTSNALDVGELRFKALGSIRGTVAGQRPWEARVTVVNSALSVNPGRDGAFFIESVPAGEQTIVAAAGMAVDSVMVTVRRGTEASAQLTIPPGAVAAGSVAGQIAIEGTGEFDNVKISADGLAMTTFANAAGQFTLPLPIGAWQLFAESTFLPRQAIGTVEIKADGHRVVLPRTIISPYVPVHETNGPMEDLEVHATCDGFSVLSHTKSPGRSRWLVLEHATRNVQLIPHVGMPSYTQLRQCFSKPALAVLGSGSHLIVHDVARRTTETHYSLGTPARVYVPSSGDVAFIHTTSNEVERVVLGESNRHPSAPDFEFFMHDTLFLRSSTSSGRFTDVIEFPRTGAVSSTPRFVATETQWPTALEANCTDDAGCELLYGSGFTRISRAGDWEYRDHDVFLERRSDLLVTATDSGVIVTLDGGSRIFLSPDREHYVEWADQRDGGMSVAIVKTSPASTLLRTNLPASRLVWSGRNRLLALRDLDNDSLFEILDITSNGTVSQRHGGHARAELFESTIVHAQTDAGLNCIITERTSTCGANIDNFPLGNRFEWNDGPLVFRSPSGYVSLSPDGGVSQPYRLGSSFYDMGKSHGFPLSWGYYGDPIDGWGHRLLSPIEGFDRNLSLRPGSAWQINFGFVAAHSTPNKSVLLYAPLRP